LTNQFVQLSSAQLRAIETADIAGVSTNQVAALSSAQIGQLLTSQLAQFSSEQLQAIETNDVRGLTTAQIAGLSSTQVGQLSTSQIVQLTSTQLRAIETADIAGLTSGQVSALVSAGLKLSTTQDALLTSQQLGSFSTNAISPLVLDLDGNGIQTISQAYGVNFDLNNDGNIDKSGWVAGKDGLLVRDISGDGVINHGGELFGEGTALADGSKAKDGYQALAALDSNLDGLIDANDAVFGSLQVWTDANGNGITDAGELKSLASLGITSISLDAVKTSVVDNGNLIGLMGSYTKADGSVHTAGDVWFSVDASGNRTFDLAAAIQQAGSSKVTLSNTQSDTLKVTLSDVLSFGQTDIAGMHQVTINGTAADTVQLANAGTGWTQTGTVSEGAETYMVYVNGNAQLLINDKIHTVIS
jgi:hypothetical protein